MIYMDFHSLISASGCLQLSIQLTPTKKSNPAAALQRITAIFAQK